MNQDEAGPAAGGGSAPPGGPGADPSSQRVSIVGWRNWGDHPVFMVFTVVATITGLVLAAMALRKDDSVARGDPCVEVVGRWDWLTTGGIVAVAEGGRLSFHLNDLTPVPTFTGSWDCSSGEIAMRWVTGFSDHLRLSDDGTRLSGTNDQTGTVISAVRAK